MAERHRVPKEILLKGPVVLVLCLLLLLEVLLNEPPAVVVEVLEDEWLLSRVICFRYLALDLVSYTTHWMLT